MFWSTTCLHCSTDATTWSVNVKYETISHKLEKVHADSFILPALATLLKFSTLCQVLSLWKRTCQRFLGKIFKKWCEYLSHILRHRKYSDTENNGYRGFHCSQLGNYTAKPSPGYFNVEIKTFSKVFPGENRTLDWSASWYNFFTRLFSKCPLASHLREFQVVYKKKMFCPAVLDFSAL